MKQIDRTATSRDRRHRRVRSKVVGTDTRPRLAVFKSNTAISAQLINDTLGTTLVTASSKGLKGTPLERSKKVGEIIAKAAQAKGITTVVFDRGGFQYIGRIKALALGAREGGLAF